MTAIGGMQTCIVLYDSFRLCTCTLDLMSTNVKLCNSFLSLNVILIKKSYVLHSFESLCKAMRADHLLGRYVVIKLLKSLYSFFHDWLCTSGVVTR